MATIKSYTDIKQSKKLAEILPLESADMYWRNGVSDKYIQCFTPFVIDEDGTNVDFDYDIPCWSLTALIDVFEDKGFFYKLYFDGVSNVLEVVNIDNPNIHEMNYNDYPIDACVEMIEKLHERKML